MSSGSVRRSPLRGPDDVDNAAFTPAEPLPEKAYGRWYDGLTLIARCRCGHDVGEHGSRTAKCTRCGCGVFRPAGRWS